MKVHINLKKLNEMIDLSTRFVAKNDTLPILQNIYLKGTIDSLIIRATDMEKYIEVEMPWEVKIEGAITTNAKTFSDILKNIEEEEKIELNVDQKTQILTIKTSKDTFDINGISASEYIALPEVPQDNIISLDTQIFSSGIEKVEYAVTEKNFSPILTGVLIKAQKEKNQIIFVGTDSFRLAEYKLPAEWNEDNFSLILPKVSINDIKKISDYAKDRGCEEIKLQFSENLAAFQCEIENIKILATSLLIQGSFPDYEREDIMPKEFNTTIMVDKTLCDKAIKKIAILTRDINNFIQIETQQDKILITSGKTDKGAGTTSIPAIISGNDLSFGINWRYVTDFIKIMLGDELTFNIVDGQKPLILTDKWDDNYKYVVRPLINN